MSIVFADGFDHWADGWFQNEGGCLYGTFSEGWTSYYIYSGSANTGVQASTSPNPGKECRIWYRNEIYKNLGSADTEFSLSAWVKQTGSGGGKSISYPFLAMHDTFVASNQATFGVTSNSSWYYVVFNNTPIQLPIASDADVWHHWEITGNTTTNAFRVYVDGESLPIWSSDGVALARAVPYIVIKSNSFTSNAGDLTVFDNVVYKNDSAQLGKTTFTDTTFTSLASSNNVSNVGGADLAASLTDSDMSDTATYGQFDANLSEFMLKTTVDPNALGYVVYARARSDTASARKVQLLESETTTGNLVSENFISTNGYNGVITMDAADVLVTGNPTDVNGPYRYFGAKLVE